MEVEWGSEFEKALGRAEIEANSDDQVANVRYKYLLALLRELEELHNRPNFESRTFKRESSARSLRLRQGQVG